MQERMIFAGAGGQGLMTLGKVVAQAVMEADLNVTWYPSYGAEVRGGTAHCHVVVSDSEIYSPIVEQASAMIIMNQPSLQRFESMLSDGGILVLNTSLADMPESSNGTVLAVPATDIANELKSIRVANMAMLGALNAARRIVDDGYVRKALGVFLSGRQDLLELNLKAYERGRKCVAREVIRGPLRP